MFWKKETFLSLHNFYLVVVLRTFSVGVLWEQGTFKSVFLMVGQQLVRSRYLLSHSYISHGTEEVDYEIGSHLGPSCPPFRFRGGVVVQKSMRTPYWVTRKIRRVKLLFLQEQFLVHRSCLTLSQCEYKIDIHKTLNRYRKLFCFISYSHLIYTFLSLITLVCVICRS